MGKVCVSVWTMWGMCVFQFGQCGESVCFSLDNVGKVCVSVWTMWGMCVFQFGQCWECVCFSFDNAGNLCQTPHSGYVTLCYFNHCQHKTHVTMVYHVIDSKLQPLFTTHTVSQWKYLPYYLQMFLFLFINIKGGSRRANWRKNNSISLRRKR